MNTLSIKLSKTTIALLSAAALVATYIAPLAVYRAGAQAPSCDDPALSFAGGTSNILGTGTPGSGVGEFNEPADLTVDALGNIYVADYLNHRIQKFDSTGAPANFTFTGTNILGSLGTGVGEFNRTNDVELDSAGNIYVVDRQNHRIQKFDSTGAPANFTFTGTNILTSGFTQPGGVAIDTAGNIYVADTFNNRIQKFDSTGAPDSFQSTGVGPRDVDVDAAGNVYVALQNGHVIEKYNSSFDPENFTFTGTNKLGTGVAGSGVGQFDTPRDVHVDALGNIYVADNNHRIQKFDSTGAPANDFAGTNVFGTSGTAVSEFRFPDGVFVDSSGAIYVADQVNYRIQKFGCPPPPPPPLDQCTLDALALAGIDSSDVDQDFLDDLDDVCVANPANVIVIEAEDVVKGGLDPTDGEVYIIGDGAIVKGGIHGDGGGTVILGDGTTTQGGIHDVEAVHFSGNVSIGGGVNGGVGPVGSFVLGEGANLSVSGGVGPVTALFEVQANSVLVANGTTSCPGATVVQDASAVLTLGNNSCTGLVAYIWPAGGGGGLNLATILPTLGLALLGLAVYVRPRVKKKK